MTKGITNIEDYKDIINESNRLIRVFNDYKQTHQLKSTDYEDNRLRLPSEEITAVFNELYKLWESKNKLEELKLLLHDENFLKKFDTIKLDSFLFVGTVTLPHEIIVYPIIFENCQFSGIDLSNRKFYNTIEFRNCRGATSLICKKTEFYNNLSVRFVGGSNTIQADFAEAIFKGIIHFSRIEFPNKAIFSKAKFQSYSSISGGFVYFDNCQFMEGADFSGLEVESNIKFDDILLSLPNYKPSLPGNNNIDFSNSIFYQNLDFKTLPNQPVCLDFIFKNVSFLDKVNNKVSFKGTIFNEEVIFDDSRLPNTIFTACQFKKKTSFENVAFVQPPRFFSAEINQNTIFYNSKFNTCKTPEDMLAYKTLQRLLHDAKVYTDGYKFFPLEQKIQRKFETSQLISEPLKNLHFFLNIILSWIYLLLSNYGQATWRPVIIWLALLSIFGYIFSFNLVDINPSLLVSNSGIDLDLWVKHVPLGFAYSAQSITNPFSFFNTDVPFYPKNSWVAFWAHIESFLGIVCITLWIFALKRRFQKGE